MNYLKRINDKIGNIGIPEDVSPNDRRRATLINLIIFYCCLPALITTPLVVAVAEWVNVVFIIFSILLLSISFIFSSKGNHERAFLYFITVTSIIIAFGAMLFRNTSTDIYLIPAATIPFITLKSKRKATAIFVLIMLLFVAINIAFQYIEPYNSLDGLNKEIAYVNSVILIAGMMFITLYKLKSQNDIYEADIIRQKELTEEAHKEVVDSINYAQRIQSAIMPSLEAVHDALKNELVLYLPKDVVAGDFFWMERITTKEKNEDVVYYAAADCTGHGVPGAMVSVICSNALTKSLLEEGIRETGKILDRTRELVVAQLAKSGEEVKDGMDISLCSLNMKTKELQWSGANNPLWILRNGAEDLEEIRPDKQPIGKHLEEFPFSTHNIVLNQGDSIYVFTDGYQDQFGGPRGKKFKPKNLKKLILEMKSKPMQEQKKELETKFSEWKEGFEQVDDVCVIGVRV